MREVRIDLGADAHLPAGYAGEKSVRVEALRIGLEQALAARRELRLGPVELSDSEQVRLQRLAPSGFVKPGPASGVLILPAPQDILPQRPQRRPQLRIYRKERAVAGRHP